MKKIPSLILGLAGFFLSGCCGCDQNDMAHEDVIHEEPMLTFAVAGHVYGNPDEYTYSIYPRFLEKFKAEQEKNPVDYLFLTGDVVKFSVDSVWNIVINELDALGVEWYLAAGNHDLGPDAQYVGGLFHHGFHDVVVDGDNTEDDSPEQCISGLHNAFSCYERDTWFFGEGLSGAEQNQFLVLNTSSPGWTVDSTDRARLDHYLNSLHPDSVDNIFVFTHQLWWQHNNRKDFGLDSITANSHTLMAGESDFWQDAFPLFEEKGIETWFFAGDLGASTTLPFYYEDHYENFHFYASGMGGGTEDNYLRVSVYEDGDVQIERIDF